MKVIKFLSMLMLAMAMPLLVSCGGDDDEEPLENVIVGKWHSYKATISAANFKKTVDVTQNGENAAFYMEATFSSNGTVVVKGWNDDENNQTMYWGTEEKFVYTIHGNDLSLTAENGEKIGAKYYPKDKYIIWTMLVKDKYSDGLITSNLYFKK